MVAAAAAAAVVAGFGQTIRHWEQCRSQGDPLMPHRSVDCTVLASVGSVVGTPRPLIQVCTVGVRAKERLSDVAQQALSAE